MDADKELYDGRLYKHLKKEHDLQDKEVFVDRYIEKEVQRMEDSIGRDLKKQVKLNNEDSIVSQ